MLHPLQILEQYWGHTGFRPNQQKIIEAVLENEDCLALLPTGGGKSVCFQVPALIKEGICIVVSPLIALILSSTCRPILDATRSFRKTAKKSTNSLMMLQG